MSNSVEEQANTQYTNVEVTEPEKALEGEKAEDLNLTDERFHVSLTNLKKLVNNGGRCLCVDRKCPCEPFKQLGKCVCDVFFKEKLSKAKDRGKDKEKKKEE